MKPSRFFIALLLALAGGSARAADNEQAAREQVGKPVQQAQLLVRQKKDAEALARLKEADAVPNKSTYESYIIEETRAVALIDSGDYAGAVKALDAVLATHVLPPADAAKRRLSLVQLDYRLKDYAKTVAAAQSYYREGGTDPEPRRLMAQSYYLAADYAHAAEAIRAVLDAGGASKQAEETLLLSLASSEFKLNHQDAYVGALERLVGAYPKHEYWVDLCRAVRQKPGFAPRLQLDLDRLEVAGGVFDNAEQYVDAAQLALEQGFPGDARAFLDKGYAAGLLGKGAAAERQKRLSDMAKRQSDEDVKSLAAQAQEAEASASGSALEKLGEAYTSYGRYDEAIIALTNSLKKGGLKNADDARLHLGVANLLAGGRPAAMEALSAVRGTDGSGDLARLWLIRNGP